MRKIMPFLFFACFTCVSTFADSIDIAAYLTRVNTKGHSLLAIGGLILLLLAIDYLWNLLIIGLSAMRVCAASRAKILIGLIIVTLLGQVADRLGAFLAAITAGPVVRGLLRLGAEGWALYWLVGNIIFSGIAIALLVWFFVRKRWLGSKRAALILAIVAAFLANPAIALFIPIG
jgi:hypothetical protein